MVLECAGITIAIYILVIFFDVYVIFVCLIVSA